MNAEVGAGRPMITEDAMELNAILFSIAWKFPLALPMLLPLSLHLLLDSSRTTKVVVQAHCSRGRKAP